MALNKIGSSYKLKVIKYGGFTIDPNYISEILLKQWPKKQLTIDDLHTAIKQIGVVDYGPDDLSVLIGRLEAVGFSVTK
jgi:hypothetical protein